MNQALTCVGRSREFKTSLIVLCALLVLGNHTVGANPPPHKCAGPLIGTWKLQSFVREDAATGQKTEPYGAHPNGYIHYGADCRMYVMVVKENRKAPATDVPTDAERIELFGGPYRHVVESGMDGYYPGAPIQDGREVSFPQGNYSERPHWNYRAGGLLCGYVD